MTVSLFILMSPMVQHSNIFCNVLACKCCDMHAMLSGGRCIHGNQGTGKRASCEHRATVTRVSVVCVPILAPQLPVSSQVTSSPSLLLLPSRHGVPVGHQKDPILITLHHTPDLHSKIKCIGMFWQDATTTAKGKKVPSDRFPAIAISGGLEFWSAVQLANDDRSGGS